MTVSGPIAPADVGIALVHEHLYTEFIGFGELPSETRKLDWSTAAEARWNPLAFPDNGRFTNVDLTISELSFLKAVGGTTVVDVTPIVLRRNPPALLEISRRSGLHVVMGGGYFTEPFHPQHVRQRTADDLAREFIAEVRDGVDTTGIRPGILGELGAGEPFTDQEAKLLRASAWASRETGLALTVHVQPLSRNGPAVLDVLTAEGISSDRIILGHMTPMIGDDPYQRSLLDRGAFLAYDFIGMDHAIYAAGRYVPSDYEVAKKVAELVAAGYAGQLLLSQDTSELIRLKAYGGWGFSHVLDHFVPLLGTLGVGEADITRMLVDNPRRLLTIRSGPGAS